VSFRDPGVRDFTVRRRERVFMMALMHIDFSIRIRIQSVGKSGVRNNDLMKVASDNQNGRENDQRRKRDIDTQKPIPFAATKSLFFYVIFFLPSSSKRSNIFFDSSFSSVERHVAFPKREGNHSNLGYHIKP
jgi:hypothetical protein